MRAVESRAFRGTFYGFIQFGLLFIQTILLVPLLLSNWGKDKYGIYIAVFAFIQLLRTLDFGHQTYIGNEFNKRYFLDRKKAILVLASSVKMAFILGGLEFLIFIAFWITGAITPILGIDIIHSTLIFSGILCMVLMWWTIGSVAGVMTRAVLRKGFYTETVIWGIGLKSIEIVFLVIAGIVNISLFNLLWIWALINVIYLTIATIWATRQLIKFKEIWGAGTWEQAFLGLRNSFILTINNGFEQLNSNGIIFLITRFISLSILPVYITIRTMTNTAIQFTGLIINPLQPELIRYHSEKSAEKIYGVIQAVWIISGVVVNFALLAVIPFISWLYSIWTKGILPFNRELFFILCLGTSIVNFGKVLTSYLTGINDLKAITILSGSRCILVFGISFIFINEYGLIAIGMGFLIAEVVSSIIIPLYLTKRNLQSMHMYIDIYGIFLALLPTLILAICYLVDLSKYINPLIISIIGIGIMCLIYLIQWKRLHVEVRDRLESYATRIYRKIRMIRSRPTYL